MNIVHCIFKHADRFEIKYLRDLFTDTSFHHVICVYNNTWVHKIINGTKQKQIMECQSDHFDLSEYINRATTGQVLIHGVSVALKHLTLPPHWVYTERLTDNHILEVYRVEAMRQLHQQLSADLDMMTQDKLTHRLVFGKDLKRGILQMTLQTLYCSEERYDQAVKGIPPNFHLYRIEVLNDGDPGDRLKRDFSGAVGVTYY